MDEDDISAGKRKIIEKHKRAAARQRAKDKKRQEENIFDLKKLVESRKIGTNDEFPKHINHAESAYTLDVFARVFEEKLQTYIERERKI